MTHHSRPVPDDREPEDELVASLFRSRRQGELAGAACPAPELVQAYRVSTLPADLQDRVGRHVARCAVCQALGQALDDPAIADLTPLERNRILNRVYAELDPPTRRFGIPRVWLPAAAVAALAVMLSVLLWQFRTAPPPIDATSAFRLEKAPIADAGAVDLLWRGSGASGAGDALARALEPYRANDFAEAARQLRAFVSRYPASAAGWLYLGVSRLFVAADADAITALENAERLADADSQLADEAAWYLALAYRRAGQLDRTIRKLDALCQGARARAASACLALAEVSKESPVPRSR